VGCCTYSSRGIHVLGENYALRLDDKEVDELLHIVEHALKRSLGDGVVLTRAELRSQTAAECQLSCDFCSGGRTQSKVEELETVADDVKVSSGEDEDDGRTKGDTGRTRVLPAQEAVEHAVVVYLLLARCMTGAGGPRTSKLLAGRRLVVWSLSRVGKISKLVAGLAGLCLHILANGS
jgi:hypothetical protein